MLDPTRLKKTLRHLERLDRPLREPLRTPFASETGRTVAIVRRSASGRAASHARALAVDSTLLLSSRRPVDSRLSGTNVSTHPARSETSSGRPHAAASFTTRPQGSIRLGCTNAEANAYQRASSPDWRKPGRWIDSAQPLASDYRFDRRGVGPSPQRTRSHAASVPASRR